MVLRDNRPVLRLVPTSQIRFHEHAERSRTLRLVRRLEEDRLLRNPPIVAGMPGGDFLLLDGANRVSAFLELGLSHIAVQLIDYGDPEIQLKGWHHLLLQGRDLDLARALEAIAGVRVERVDGSELRQLLELRMVFAALVDESQTPWALLPGKGKPLRFEVHRLIEVLEEVVKCYEGKTRLERVKLADQADLPSAIESVEHQLVLFPVLTKSELMQLSGEGVMIPTGITRHLIPGRTLGLDLDLDFLTRLETEEAKVQHFQDHYDHLLLEGRIRYYQESVFILNE